MNDSKHDLSSPPGNSVNNLRDAAEPPNQYCAVCGNDAQVHGTPMERFGERLCSETHAEQFVAAVRAERARHAAADSGPDTQSGMACAMHGTDSVAGVGQSGWKPYLWKALCWGGPALAIVLLLGGGSTVLGFAGAALPYLALLACPLAMILMMKGMGNMHQASPPDKVPAEKARPQVAAVEPGESAKADRAS